MGLLDDAIREHLEFKRQHGADSDEVARLEHEVLGPVDRGDNASPAGPSDSAEGMLGSGEEPGHSTAEVSDAPAPEQNLTHTGEETAELDMRTVLAEQPLRATAPPPEESLEWEVPSSSQSESGTGAEGEAAEDSGEPVEDVLEETPDFLRETPDQDRLWFEQQPPRDFDFDK
ncbi:MAG TPA: hypothetical protein VIC06_06645 [Solirubrobacteraceae bacterium]|jgi:hypothetical protein